MMRKICYLMIFGVLVFSCTFTEKPTFIKIKNVRVEKANLTKVIINADALFENYHDNLIQCIENNDGATWLTVALAPVSLALIPLTSKISKKKI